MLYCNILIIINSGNIPINYKSLLSSVVEHPSHTRIVTSSNLVAGNLNIYLIFGFLGDKNKVFIEISLLLFYWQTSNKPDIPNCLTDKSKICYSKKMLAQPLVLLNDVTQQKRSCANIFFEWQIENLSVSKVSLKFVLVFDYKPINKSIAFVTQRSK